MSDPISVFNAAVEALQRGQWHDAALLCDTGSLSLFKRNLLARLERQRQPWTAEHLLRHKPEISREAAEAQIARLNELSHPARILADELPTVHSVEALRDMTPIDVFAAWLDGNSLQRGLERAIHEAQLPREAADAARQLILQMTYSVLDVTRESEDTCRVAYHRVFDRAETEPTPEAAGSDSLIRFAMLRRESDGPWRMIADQPFFSDHANIFIGFDDEHDGAGDPPPDGR